MSSQCENIVQVLQSLIIIIPMKGGRRKPKAMPGLACISIVLIFNTAFQHIWMLRRIQAIRNLRGKMQSVQHEPRQKFTQDYA